MLVADCFKLNEGLYRGFIGVDAICRIAHLVIQKKQAET